MHEPIKEQIVKDIYTVLELGSKVEFFFLKFLYGLFMLLSMEYAEPKTYYIIFSFE